MEILMASLVMKEVHVSHIPVKGAFSPDCHKNESLWMLTGLDSSHLQAVEDSFYIVNHLIA